MGWAQFSFGDLMTSIKRHDYFDNLQVKMVDATAL